jgi:hypothetical protein
MAAYKSQGRQPPNDLLHKIKSYDQKMAQIQIRLRQGGKPAVIGNMGSDFKRIKKNILRILNSCKGFV